jgi:TRAP-type uncharacterized transport system substrate-binding protein
MIILSRLAAVLVVVSALVNPLSARSHWPLKDPMPLGRLQEMQIREKVNARTLALAGGLLEGAPIRLATEIAKVVNSGSDMQVLPIVTRGSTENVNDLLYLKGIDAAIINSDALVEYKSQVPQFQQRITFINLFPSEVYIFVRPEIKTLADLTGKKVNFNTQGTPAAYSGPLIFSRLGLDVEMMFIPHPATLEQMKRREISAVVFITSKPMDAFVKGKWDEGFKFLPVEFGPKLEDYYISSSLEAAVYPNLITKDQHIATIAVSTIPSAYNWPRNSQRYRRVARFVDELFGGMDKLRSAGFDAKWKDMDLKKQAPGLERFQAAQEWLDRSASKNQSARP